MHSKYEARRSLVKDNDSVSKKKNAHTGSKMRHDLLFFVCFCNKQQISCNFLSALQINNFHTLSGMVNTVTRSNTSSALDQELENKRKVELALK